MLLLAVQKIGVLRVVMLHRGRIAVGGTTLLLISRTLTAFAFKTADDVASLPSTSGASGLDLVVLLRFTDSTLYSRSTSIATNLMPPAFALEPLMLRSMDEFSTSSVQPSLRAVW